MPRSFYRLLATQALPCALSFLASFSIFAVEIASGRILARYVGAGLYTWTSVIGVVLGGLVLGNWIGGRLADRFEVRRTLATTLLGSGIACLGIPLANHWVATWLRWELVSAWSFPVRVLTHVTLVFALPSIALGLIGPLVAKLALDAGLESGRTLGRVYAWGALGSILGAFFTGFYLIAVLGSGGVALGVGGLLVAAAILLAPRSTAPILAAAWPLIVGSVLGFVLTVGRGLGEWVWADGELRVRERGSDYWLYADESQYSYIRITENKTEQTRRLLLDFLLHAVYRPADENRLMYDFAQVYATVTERLAQGRGPLEVLVLGGGGYVFPRYVQGHWPGSRVQVAEIDPAVTVANLHAFGLKESQIAVRDRADGSLPAPLPPASGGIGPAGAPPLRPLEIYHLDARNHVDDLLRLRQAGGEAAKPLDFVYGDAFNDFSVPFHLVTLELTEKVKLLLDQRRGVYLLTLIDIYELGRFLGAVLNTFRKVFPHVYVITNHSGGPKAGLASRDTFVMLGSMEPLDLTELGAREGVRPFTGTILSAEHLAHLERRSGGIVLTDDYAPVENLLKDVVRSRVER
jgi:MFS family permease